MSDDIIEAGGDGEILDEQADERAESESIEVGVWVFTYGKICYLNKANQ